MKLFFRKYGEGAPLIILHGLFGSADNWNTLGKKFGEYFTTYLVDQRNHGQSPHSEIWNYDVMAEDIFELMQDENIQKANILGHSMGGKTAMFFALKYPEKVDCLLISDISPRYYPIHHREIIDALKSLPLPDLKSRNAAEELLKETITDSATRQFLLKNLYWKDEKLAWRFNLNVIEANIEEVGKALPPGLKYQGKAIFIRGDRSNYITENDWKEIQVIFPYAELITIKNSGHWIHAEQPMEFFNAVVDRLK